MVRGEARSSAAGCAWLVARRIGLRSTRLSSDTHVQACVQAAVRMRAPVDERVCRARRRGGHPT